MVSRETDVRFVPLGESSYVKEARRNQKCALRGDTRVVKLGPIIFFCANGDAWMVDPEDRFARCLVRDGEMLPHGITEKRQQVQIGWNADYGVEGAMFLVAERTGTVRSIIGYPVDVIEDQRS